MKTPREWLRNNQLPYASDMGAMMELLEMVQRDAFGAGAETQRNADKDWAFNEVAPLVDFPEEQ